LHITTIILRKFGGNEYDQRERHYDSENLW